MALDRLILQLGMGEARASLFRACYHFLQIPLEPLTHAVKPTARTRRESVPAVHAAHVLVKRQVAGNDHNEISSSLACFQPIHHRLYGLSTGDDMDNLVLQIDTVTREGLLRGRGKSERQLRYHLVRLRTVS
jgi:hypothetical protein